LTHPSQQAKQALGARLREIRKDAKLTGRVLAAICGWHFTKVSRLEHGIQSPSEEDLAEWCHACEAADQVDDLITCVRAIESMYVEWRWSRLSVGGPRASHAFVPIAQQLAPK
jgi:transcriptional regulator with XRE-family HTH domain